MKECYMYAFVLATMFVLNLYLLVPTSVSKLPRYNERQIKWRILSVIITCSIGIISYPYIFCNGFVGFDVFDLQINRLIFAPVKHVMKLYLGSFIASVLESHATFQLQSSNILYINFMYVQFVTKLIRPFRCSKFQVARDLIIAPFAEELIFRSLMISPMLHSTEYLTENMTIWKICLTVPLFFGLAHVHHAYTKIVHDNVPVSKAIMSSGFQFIYTYLFGAYASFCYIKTKSLVSIYAVHMLCNYLSLPNISIFIVETKSLKNVNVYRAIASFSYMIGIYFFYHGFQSSFAF
jgi:membrane protease YdiL (CAAX protease family)